jgi:hypothetical protein
VSELIVQEKRKQRKELERAVENLWEDLAEEIDLVREIAGLDASDPMFRDVMKLWLGREVYESYVEWGDDENSEASR